MSIVRGRAKSLLSHQMSFIVIASSKNPGSTTTWKNAVRISQSERAFEEKGRKLTCLTLFASPSSGCRLLSPHHEVDDLLNVGLLGLDRLLENLEITTYERRLGRVVLEGFFAGLVGTRGQRGCSQLAGTTS
jgi:hypothetical protein